MIRVKLKKVIFTSSGIMLPSIFEKHKIYVNLTKSLLIVN